MVLTDSLGRACCTSGSPAYHRPGLQQMGLVGPKLAPEISSTIEAIYRLLIAVPSIPEASIAKSVHQYLTAYRVLRECEPLHIENKNRALRLPRFSGRFVSLQSTSWSWRPTCRLRRLSVSGIPGPNATAPDYTNPRCS